jgi:AmmeMemoRadiSam system protein B
MDYPKIRRDVNAFPVTVDGQSTIFVQDSQRLTEGVFIPTAVFARIVSFFDGTHSIRDIQYEAMSQYGELVYTEQIEGVVRELDGAYLLESPRFHAALERLKENFRKGSVRPAFFPGKSYAADPSELQSQLRAYFADPGGPGGEPRDRQIKGLKGIMAPHIDFQRGGPCYAFAYKALAEAHEADLYVILGIAHVPSDGQLILTLKDFETPLGVAKTDRDFVNAVSNQCSWDVFQDEFLHRSEHSIEFQILFLQSVLGSRKMGKIMPVLCGSFDRYLLEGRLPEEDPSVSEFFNAIRSAAASSGKEICFIAGVDLSHVGLQFGDTRPADGLLRSQIRQGDLEALEKVMSLDAEGFFRLVERDQNGRRICGFPAIYVLLRIMRASRGEMLKYDQGPTPDGQSVVSFAAMAFYESH